MTRTMDPDRYQMKDVKRRLTAAEKTIEKLSRSLDRAHARHRELIKQLNDFAENFEPRGTVSPGGDTVRVAPFRVRLAGD